MTKVSNAELVSNLKKEELEVSKESRLAGAKVHGETISLFEAEGTAKRGQLSQEMALNGLKAAILGGVQIVTYIQSVKDGFGWDSATSEIKNLWNPRFTTLRVAVEQWETISSIHQNQVLLGQKAVSSIETLVKERKKAAKAKTAETDNAKAVKKLADNGGNSEDNGGNSDVPAKLDGAGLKFVAKLIAEADIETLISEEIQDGIAELFVAIRAADDKVIAVGKARDAKAQQAA